MEAVHQIIDGKILSRVIDLPKSLHGMLVEITVKPINEQRKPLFSRSNLREQLRGSHTESLSGIINPQNEVNVDELRKERRAKYERVDWYQFGNWCSNSKAIRGVKKISWHT